MPAIARSEPFREQACPLGVCDGSGWILGPEDVARPCECRAERLNRGRMRGIASVIPRKYRGVSFDRPPISDLPDLPVREVRKYIKNLKANLDNGQGIWFMGDVGTGKTSLAMLISKTALQNGRTVAIYSMPKLLSRIRHTYDDEPGSGTYSSFFSQLTSVDLLHIDDVGAARQNEWVLEQLYALVNERYEAERAIMFTTNVSGRDVEARLKDVEGQIGRRTFSRLIEMSGDPIVMLGDDQRYTSNVRLA